MVSTEDLEKVRAITETLLRERFEDEFVFDPIVVRATLDQYGEDFLDISVVYDGDQENLDPRWTAHLIGMIRDKMEEVGLTAFPSPSFIPRREWGSIYRKRRKFGLL